MRAWVEDARGQNVWLLSSPDPVGEGGGACVFNARLHAHTCKTGSESCMGFFFCWDVAFARISCCLVLHLLLRRGRPIRAISDAYPGTLS
jgi:hypothetical protein